MKVAVGTTRVGTEVGREGVSVTSGSPTAASTIGVIVGRGMGVGRGTKLPQARVTSASTTKGRPARRRLAKRSPELGGPDSLWWRGVNFFMGWANHGPCIRAWLQQTFRRCRRHRRALESIPRSWSADNLAPPPSAVNIRLFPAQPRQTHKRRLFFADRRLTSWAIIEFFGRDQGGGRSTDTATQSPREREGTSARRR